MVKSNYFSYCRWIKIATFLRRPIIKNIYRGLIPKQARKNFEYFSDKKQQLHTGKHFQHFIDLYFDKKLKNFKLDPLKKDLVGKKIIWQYWAQGIEDVPPIVKVCFISVDHFKGEYEVIRLDDNNLSEYLKLPGFILEKKNLNYKFKHAFFADLIRLALLDVYGGVWLDATIFLTGNLPKKLLNMDYFMFQRDFNTPNKKKWIEYDSAYFDWNDAHKVNILNSFIVAKNNNFVIHTLFDLLMNFWLTQETPPHYFFFQIMYNELLNKNLQDKSCEIIDDTLPHLLHYKLNTPFNEDEFNSIKEKMNIHKLRSIKDKDIKKGSFYEYLINKSS
ncbi:capsular polysaccharide synthesis protein [Rodentibacter heidelbergensis]|uniref:Capsular biosynthesis protein n=1 Tax=Rodentibacter heidelbergensis TaxID=1908258 RepID=A0A1V3I777_9PAST|nr:capsular polysaccharide synthesis protein [Rodentibacter heidelbergensis]OOF35812.1 capsular biosynthesis protein [Rodentibacter heidelbergensis]